MILFKAHHVWFSFSLPEHEDEIVNWYYPILLIFSISTINLYKCKHKSRVLDFMTVKKKFKKN